MRFCGLIAFFVAKCDIYYLAISPMINAKNRIHNIPISGIVFFLRISSKITGRDCCRNYFLINLLLQSLLNGCHNVWVKGFCVWTELCDQFAIATDQIFVEIPRWISAGQLSKMYIERMRMFFFTIVFSNMGNLTS